MAPSKSNSTSESNSLLSPKALLLAALYTAGRPVSTDELSKITNLPRKEIDSLISDIKKEFSLNQYPFQIIKLAGYRYSFQLAPEYVPLVKHLAPGSLFPASVLKTLSLIAVKQPVRQSVIAKIRGSQAYGHIKKLIEKGFVKAKVDRRTKILVTTPLFSDYFGLPYDKRKLKMKLKKMAKHLESTPSS